jgi:hypothetical protein
MFFTLMERILWALLCSTRQRECVCAVVVMMMVVEVEEVVVVFGGGGCGGGGAVGGGGGGGFALDVLRSPALTPLRR